MVWTRWPEEIEADLLIIRGIDIAHWHRLTLDPETGCPRLSSRRLLLLLDKLPDTSEFKKASERNGRQTRAERVQEETYNELATLRASYHTVNTENGDGYYEPFLYHDPVDERIRAERKAAEEAANQQSQNRFESDMGFS